jgi:hypothetical protein
VSSFLITNEDQAWRVELNGVDITKYIADGGVKMTCRQWPLPPAVELTLIPQR